MNKIIDKTVTLSLDGVDGNAYSIMSAFSRQAWTEGWSNPEIEAVLGEAKKGDYDHLVATIENHCTEPNPSIND